MTSNTLRYIAAGLGLAAAVLGIFGLVTPTQAHALTSAIFAGYLFAQGQLSPATNQRTPDNAPPAAAAPK